MGKINVLSFAVANLIAAGEVVDRPSSVIKELLENAIDSGATHVTVEIKNGGITYMRVSDDGCGIEAEDLPIAIKRHATSKIKTSDDLMKILTLGFRGEALAAIASVSDMRIISKTADSDYGAMIESHGGEIVEYSEQAARNGTTVIVENLFANIPARRKFLKRDATEGSAIGTIIEKIALSHPEIAFRFISDGTVRLETPGDGKLENVIYIVMGRQMQNAMIYVDSTINNIKITGYIGRSDVVKSNRNFQNFFINNRFIKSKLAIAAIEQAYTSYLPPEKYPCCVLNLTIDPSIVDINVHPTKLEVKFADEKPVFEAIYHTVRTALEENTTRPEISLGRTPVEMPSRITAEQYRSISESRPVSQAFAPIVNSRNEDKPQQIKLSEQTSASLIAENRNCVANEATIVPSSENNDISSESVKQFEELDSYTDEQISKVSPDRLATLYINYFENFIDPNLPCLMEGEDEEYPEELLESDDNITNDKSSELVMTSYRLVGEVFNSYLIVEIVDKMLIIDKHAAHERIIFEQLKAGLKDVKISSQMLMLPMDVMMTSDEIQAICDYRSEIEAVGFEFTASKYSISVTAIPEGIESDGVIDMLIVMAERIKSGTGSAGLTKDIVFEKALYQASCKAAIKAGREYSKDKVKAIVDKLMQIPDITVCPHGRPVAMILDKKNLDRQFERT